MTLKKLQQLALATYYISDDRCGNCCHVTTEISEGVSAFRCTLSDQRVDPSGTCGAQGEVAEDVP